MKPNGGGGDHHRHNGQAVQPVGQVHGVAGADDDKGAEGNEEPAEIDLDGFEEGDGKLGGERRLADLGDDRGGDQRRDTFDNDLDTTAEALGRLLGDFEIIVVEPDGAIDEGEKQDHPNIWIAQIAPEQDRDGDAGQDHQPAHRRRALLLQKGALGTFFPDRLALALADAQRLDDLRPEQEHE
jgi:hypothetical protein